MEVGRWALCNVNRFALKMVRRSQREGLVKKKLAKKPMKRREHTSQEARTRAFGARPGPRVTMKSAGIEVQ